MPYGNDTTIKFKKNGTEVKNAITSRLEDLAERLHRRDTELEKVMSDPTRLRSYLVRDRGRDSYFRPSQVSVEIPSEDHQRITELCTRICLIEKEISKLSVIRENTRDDQEFSLTYDELLELGFGARDQDV